MNKKDLENKSKAYITEFEEYLHKMEKNMKNNQVNLNYITVMHYQGLEFELSFEYDGTYYQDIYVTVDQTTVEHKAESIYGLPAEFEEIEDLLIEAINEQCGYEVEEESINYELEHEQHIKNLYFS